MSELSDRNKQLVERFFNQVFNEGNMEVVDELISPQYKFNGHASADPVDSTKKWAIGLRAQFPDLHFTVEVILAEDDKVALRWRMEGTAVGTNTKGHVIGTNIIVMADGQAVTNDQSGGDSFIPDAAPA